MKEDKMPLHKGNSKKVISENIKEMQKTGHTHNVAVAAALNNARKYGNKIPNRHIENHR
jgi:hypothetical protein